MTARRWSLAGMANTWQDLIALAGAVAFGAAVAFALAGWIKLPAQVEEQGNAIVELRTDVSVLQRSDSTQTADLKWLVCVTRAELSKRDPIEWCGL